MPIQRCSRQFSTERLEQRLLLTANELVPFSYALVTGATTERTELASNFSYNGTGEGVLVQKTETGKYRVDFEALGVAGQDGGNVQVSAYGDAGHYCKAVFWTSNAETEIFSAGVSCFDSNGDAVDSAFSLAVLHPFSVRPFIGTPSTETFELPDIPDDNEGQTYFAWVSDFGAASFEASELYVSNRGNDVLVTRTDTGRYRVNFQDLGDEIGGTVQVTGYGSDNIRCSVAGWVPIGDDFTATVRCSAPDGTATNGAFSIAVIPAETDSSLAFIWANDATRSDAYAPNTAYAHNPSGGEIEVDRRATGNYRVTFSDASRSPTNGGNVQVTAYGTLAVHCNVTDWDSTTPNLVVDVGCFDSSGNETDSRFTVFALAAPDGDRFEPNDRAIFATDLGTTGDQTLDDLSILSCGTPECSVPDYFLWTSLVRGPVTVSITSPNETDDLDLELFAYGSDVEIYYEDFDLGLEDIYLRDESLTPGTANESLLFGASEGESFLIRVKGADGISTNDEYRLEIDVAEDYLSSLRFDPFSEFGRFPPAIAHGDPVSVSFDYRTDEPDGVRVFVTPINNGIGLTEFATGPPVVYEAPSGSGTQFFTFDSGNETVDAVRVTMTTADGSTVLHEEVRSYGVDYQFGADLWMDITPQHLDLDVSYDWGREPDLGMAGVPAWRSRSIWIRDSEGDPGPNGNHLDHENPHYGRTNEIYVNVRNRGAVASEDAMVEVYVADASSGLSWSDDFELVGTANVSSVTAGGAQIVSVPWDPAGRGHYCIVTRIISDEDPITFPEDPDLDITVFQNNNFAWRNVNTMDMTAHGVLDSEFVLRNIVDTTLDLGLEFTDENNFVKAIGSNGGVAVDLGNLRERWVKSGAAGKNIELTNSGLIRLTSLPAKITGLNLDGDEEHVVRIRTEALEPLDLPGETTTFSFAVTQLAGDKPMGGVAYNLFARGRDADTDGDGTLDTQDDDDDNDGVVDKNDINPVNKRKDDADS